MAEDTFNYAETLYVEENRTVLKTHTFLQVNQTGPLNTGPTLFISNIGPIDDTSYFINE